MVRNSNPFVGVGIYSVSEASRLSGVSRARIRRWLRGYTFKHGTGIHESPPVWRRQLPSVGNSVALGFLDLMEVRFVNAFLEKGVSWRTIRRAAEIARRKYNKDHPFSTRQFKTDGKRMFEEVIEKSGENKLLDIVSNQYAFQRILAPYLKGVEFDRSDNLVRWWPLGPRRQVVIDPQRSFGQPIAAAEGVPTSILYRAYQVEDSVLAVASWYEVSRASVRAAVEFEKILAA
jgi:uncharacterized protein (DUF433 family)